MACNKPYLAQLVTLSDGSQKINFKISPKYQDNSELIHVPCGRCMGCRIDYSRDWTTRNMHELKMHVKACFLTLTYNDDYLPWSENGEPTLLMDDLQKFLKRMRKRLGKFRYFACGEYGDSTHRPHYHLILYGVDFDDKELFSSNFNGDKYYVSDTLNSLWKYGHSLIGEVSYQSIAYVSRYIMKKIKGDSAQDVKNYYTPEFVTMSRRPGIGYNYFVKHYKDWFKNGFCLVNKGDKLKKHPIPKYYFKSLEKLDPELYNKHKLSMIDFAKNKMHNLLYDEKCLELYGLMEEERKSRELCLLHNFSKFERKGEFTDE